MNNNDLVVRNNKVITVIKEINHLEIVSPQDKQDTELEEALLLDNNHIEIVHHSIFPPDNEVEDFIEEEIRSEEFSNNNDSNNELTQTYCNLHVRNDTNNHHQNTSNSLNLDSELLDLTTQTSTIIINNDNYDSNNIIVTGVSRNNLKRKLNTYATANDNNHNIQRKNKKSKAVQPTISFRIQATLKNSIVTRSDTNKNNSNSNNNDKNDDDDPYYSLSVSLLETKKLSPYVIFDNDSLFIGCFYNNLKRLSNDYIDPNNSIQLAHYNQFKHLATEIGFDLCSIKKVEFILNPVLLKEFISFLESDSVTDKRCLFGLHGSKSRNLNSIIKNGFYLPDEVVKRKLIKRPPVNAHGKGIYLSEHWHGLSPGYNRRKHIGELLICITVPGKQLYEYPIKHDLESLISQGYHSFSNKGGILVLFTPKQILPIYRVTYINGDLYPYDSRRNRERKDRMVTAQVQIDNKTYMIE